MDKPLQILAIDDERMIRYCIRVFLEKRGHNVIEAEDGESGLEIFKKNHFDIVICDLRMPGMDGLELLEEMTRTEPEIPVIIVSGTEDMTDAVRSLRLGAWDYLIKPIDDLTILEHSVQKVAERARLIRENRENREHLEKTNRMLEQSLAQLQEDETAARRIQFQLLPPTHAIHSDYEFNRYLKTSACLSGDFIDYFTIDKNHIGFYIADVSGHGVSSAFVTVLLKSTMTNLLEQYRQNASDTILHPDLVLKLINDDIVRQDFGKYLTMFYTIINIDEQSIRFSNGGQYPFPIISDGQKTLFIGEKNLPVGLFKHATFKSYTQKISESFTMGMFSDGVLEILPQENLDSKNEFLLSMMSEKNIAIDDIIIELGLESMGAPSDDVTLLLIKRKS